MNERIAVHQETHPCGKDQASTSQFYEEFAAEYFDRTVAADMSASYSRFLPLLPVKARILDAGCGSGRDLKVFRERGYQAIGLDASAALAQLARDYANAPCIVGRIEDLQYECHFQGIWACASLLHLAKPLFVRALHRLHQALTFNGILYISVQEGAGERVAADGRFFRYFEEKELLDAVRSSGLFVGDIWFSEDTLLQRSTARWLNVIARRSAKT